MMKDKLTAQPASADVRSATETRADGATQKKAGFAERLRALRPARRREETSTDGEDKKPSAKRAAIAVALALALVLGGAAYDAYAASYWKVTNAGSYVKHTYKNGTTSKTKDYHINGIPAICIEHSTGSANTGDTVSLKTVNSTYEPMRKALYYGTNGPGSDAICCLPMTSIAASQANYWMGGTDRAKDNSTNGRSIQATLDGYASPPSWFRVRLWNNESSNSRQDLATYACETLVRYYPNGGTAKSSYPLGSNGASATTSSVWSDGISSRNSDGTVNTVNLSAVDIYNVATLFERTGYHVASDATAWRIGSASAKSYMSQSSANLSGYTSRSKQTVVSLYANWVANTYYVAYAPNGGSGSMEKSTFTYDVTGNLRANDELITRDGYTFAGWNEKADGTGKSYADGASVRNLTATNNATITLYAQWVKNDYCYIDGYGGKDTNDGMTPSTPVKTFKQAYTNVKDTGGTIYVVNTVPVSKNMTLSSTYYQEASGKVAIASGESVKVKRYSQPTEAASLEGFNVPSNTNVLINVDAGTLTLSSITVDGHDDAVTTGAEMEVAPKATAYGALVLVQESGSLEVSPGTVLANNTNANDGSKTTPKGWTSTAGAIQNNGTLTMTGGTVSDNAATAASGSGAGIWNLGSATIAGGTVSGNSAKHSGGGVANGSTSDPASLVVAGGTFEGNSAGTAGGAVWNAAGSTATISAGGFEGNSAGEQGGAVYNTGTMEVCGGDVAGNTATGGGGVSNWGVMAISSGTVSENTASSQGGGVYNASELTITGGEVSGNSATYGGGFVNRGDASISGGTMNGNSATHGGGVYNASELKLTGGAVSGNSARNLGSGVYQGGTLAMSEDASVDLGNDVYLAAGRHVDVPAALTADGAAAILTPSDYTLGRTVARIGYGAELASIISDSFELTPNEPYTLRPGDYLDTEAAVAESDVVISRTYIVTYDGNENTELTAQQIKWWHETLRLFDDIPEFTGYFFDNWNMSRDGSGKAYDPGDEFTDNADTTLYAQWIAKSYHLAYDGNGHDGGQSMATTDHTYGVEFQLAENAFTKTGYHFTTWNTEKGGAGTAYDNMQTVSNLTDEDSATVTLYAQWEANPYVVAYNGNGADGGGTADVGHFYDKMGYVSENGFTRTGYEFSHWSTEQDDAGTSYKPGDEVWNWTDVANGKVVLYAQWTPIEYDIAFNANGGDAGRMDAVHCVYDEDKALPEVGFTRTGHKFVSWNTEPDGSGASFDDAQVVRNLTDVDGATVTLYAQWEALPYVLDVSGLLDGEKHDTIGDRGTFDVYVDGLLVAVDVNDFKREIVYGTSYEITDITVNDSYEYLGVAEGLLSGTIPAYDSEVVLSYKAPSYTVRYDANGGEGTMADSVHRYGIWKSLSPNAYSMDKFTFTGWCTEPDGDGVPYSDCELVRNLTDVDGGVVTLYAQWGINTYTVHYDGNGADSGQTPDSEHVIGVARNLTKNGFERTGYTFTGWNGNVDGGAGEEDLEVEMPDAYAAVYTSSDGLENVLVFGRHTVPETYGELVLADYWNKATGTDVEALDPASPAPWTSKWAPKVTDVAFATDYEITPACTAGWFSGMGKVTDLDLALLNTTNASSMEGMFDGMEALSTVTLGAAFSFKGNGDVALCALPDGLWEWVAASDGKAYAAADVPGSKADTYTRQDKVPEAYALVLDYSAYGKYSEAPYELAFARSYGAPQAGDYYGSSIYLPVIAVYEGVESLSGQPWADYSSKIRTVSYLGTIEHPYGTWDAASTEGEVRPTSMSGWFANFTNCETMDLSHFNMSECTDATGLFMGCDSLESIALGESFSFTGDGSASCTLPEGNWKHVETGSVYSAADLAASYDGSADMVGTYVKESPAYAALYRLAGSEGALVFGRGESAPETYTNAEGDVLNLYKEWTYSNGQDVEGGRFVGYDYMPWTGYIQNPIYNITSVDVVDVIAPVDTMGWFHTLYYIKSIDLTNMDTSRIVNASSMFGYLPSSITSAGTDPSCDLILPADFCSNATTADLSYMFQGCTSLTSLDLPDGFGSNVTTGNMSHMFQGCTSLTSLDLPDGFGSNVTTGGISNMFRGCSSLETLDLSSLRTVEASFMSYMFQNCSSLETIYASDLWSTDTVTSSEYMFSGCTKLKGDIAFNSSYDDKTYAKTSGGYLTYKAAPSTASVASLDDSVAVASADDGIAVASADEGTSAASYSLRSGVALAVSEAVNSGAGVVSEALASSEVGSAPEAVADVVENNSSDVVDHGAADENTKLPETGLSIASLVKAVTSPTVAYAEETARLFADQEEVIDLTTIPGATVTLYAQWIPNNYTVHYQPNGGSGTTADSKHVYDTKSALTANGFAREGYRFVSWNTEKDGSGDSYLDGHQVLNLTAEKDGEVTLYAQWEPISYTVDYIGNGSTRGVTAKSTHLYDVDKNLTANGFVRDGHAFSHWTTEPDGSGTSYKNEQAVRNLTPTDGGKVVLYAQWTPLDYTLDVNGILDGIPSLDVSGYGTFDVYIDGELVADDVAEYRVKHPYGTPYEITDIRSLEGKVFVQVASGTLKGTVSNATMSEGE